MTKSLIVLGTIVFVVSSAGVGSARPGASATAKVAEARESYREGQQRLAAKEYEEALVAFLHADELGKAPATRLGMARALEGLGRLMEAREAARSVAGIASPQSERQTHIKAKRDAEMLAMELDYRIPRLRILNAAAIEAAIFIDGEPVSGEGDLIDADPGPHVLIAKAAGYRQFEKSFSLEEQRQLVIRVNMESESNAPPEPSSGAVTPDKPPSGTAARQEYLPEEEEEAVFAMGPVAWTGIGVASAGVLVGTLAGVMTMQRVSELEQVCTAGEGSSCFEPEHEQHDDALMSAHISTAGFVLAGLGAGVALAGMFALDDRGGDKVLVRPVISPSFWGVRGSF